LLQIVCCLKSGGDFDWDYVDKLHENLKDRIVNFDFKFTVFTDKIDRFSLYGINIQSLTTDLESYWSKLEVFKMKGQVIYFDLDIILKYELTDFFKAVTFSPFRSNGKSHFYMMEGFHKDRRFNSSIMGWNGDFSHLLTGINKETIEKYDKWDQEYITDTVLKTNEILSVNDYVNVASYKHNCQDGVHPLIDAVVFHGHPRPRDVNWLQGEYALK
jgi:hypothetical protein